ncbi:MAG: polyphosphate kinase 1 [Eggerthellaceae bacterium]|nr:polyphosphate kinase 1 [Eggerthellaceae bacterium]
MSQQEDPSISPVPEDTGPTSPCYMQNRELSWLDFNERVLDQGSDETVPLLERLNFISIFWSNLQEFFMVRVGSLTDLSLLKKPVIDVRTGMTPLEQIEAIHARCHALYPLQESAFQKLRLELAAEGISHVYPDELTDEQRAFVIDYARKAISPLLSPQIVNAMHPFPHLENGALYTIVRLKDKNAETEPDTEIESAANLDAPAKMGKKKKDARAKNVTLGIIPLPHLAKRIIPLPGEGFSFLLLEHALELIAEDIFSMYRVVGTNIICVTRNADLDADEGVDESGESYREHMKKILKKRGRLAPVRLESFKPLSGGTLKFLTKRLGLKPFQTYVTSAPLDLSYTCQLADLIPEERKKQLSYAPFTPQWPSDVDKNRSIIEQVMERDILLEYPYQSIDPFVQLLREASRDPKVVSIKITLYRLASHSHIAEALIDAAEAGKEVTALFELRARFDESNNIMWSQRFEEAGAKVIYGFRDYKVHCKVCCITRQTDQGIEYITQLGTGNYNEKTARLYTDMAFITSDPAFADDALELFRNMGLETLSDAYPLLCVAPLQIKQTIMHHIDEQIERAHAGKPNGIFFKTNAITDYDVIEKISQASQAGVHITIMARGISCIVPGIPVFTENVRVVSIVGRLLEHSRIYGFGPREDMEIYLSSADLMTRNLDKRIEVAWPITNDALRKRIIDYISISLSDTAKLRELKSDGSYTALGEQAARDTSERGVSFDSQEYLIERALQQSQQASHESTSGKAPKKKLSLPKKPSLEQIRQMLPKKSAKPTSKTTKTALPKQKAKKLLGGIRNRLPKR